MRKATTLHEKAMLLAETADTLRAKSPEDARQLYRKAFDLERSAAFQFIRKTEVEPTRSVLFRSAASLALECDDFIEAERMIAYGLAGEPPIDTRVELRHLYEMMHFRLFLHEAKLELARHEIVVSLWGNGLSSEFAPLREVLERLKKAERIIYKTAERKSGLPFNEDSDSPQEIRMRFPVYQRMQMAASYAAILQVGQTDRQLALPFGLDAADIVAEVVECLSSYAVADTSQLEARIENPAYRRNFVALARALYPKKRSGIHGVGIAGIGADGRHKAIEFVDPPKVPVEPATESTDWQTMEKIQIVGILNAARSQRQTRRVEIEDDYGDTHRIDVQEGMMADVVRPFYEARVVADVSRLRSGGLVLVDVNLASDSTESS